MTKEIIALLSTSATTILASLVSFLIVFIKHKTNLLRIKNLEDILSQEKCYFINCPHCGQKIMLREAKIQIDSNCQMKKEEEKKKN